ncbi:hypothetical protein LSH36_783g00012 [Paralvinella palmiformis]|uniref:Uncharacterized protein n=1 Tax=Paralvinella palmiformis TaxID=53620 RepID=A0AAD9J0L2_9ANNE|nr:hypothetical protein LSH36_783g00012 [Paralvinella palmiformis]
MICRPATTEIAVVSSTTQEITSSYVPTIQTSDISSPAGDRDRVTSRVSGDAQRNAAPSSAADNKMNTESAAETDPNLPTSSPFAPALKTTNNSTEEDAVELRLIRNATFMEVLASDGTRERQQITIFICAFYLLF